MSIKHKALFLIASLLAFESVLAETTKAQDSLQLLILEPLDAVVKGKSLIGEETLYFEANYQNDASPLYVISLDINNKKWSTYIAIISEQEMKLSVKSEGITLIASERSHLKLAAEEAYQLLGDEIKDTLAARLLIQMMTYWSQSPADYRIIDRDLGG